jgi:hypothetical protein
VVKISMLDDLSGKVNILNAKATPASSQTAQLRRFSDLLLRCAAAQLAVFADSCTKCRFVHSVGGVRGANGDGSTSFHFRPLSWWFLTDHRDAGWWQES